MRGEDLHDLQYRSRPSKSPYQLNLTSQTIASSLCTYFDDRWSIGIVTSLLCQQTHGRYLRPMFISLMARVQSHPTRTELTMVHEEMHWSRQLLFTFSCRGKKSRTMWPCLGGHFKVLLVVSTHWTMINLTSIFAPELIR